MGLGSILVLLTLLVSLIVFIYLVVKTARGWGVLHTLLICTLFIECWVFLFMSAGVHYERVRATEAAAKATKDAKQALARTEQLLWSNEFDVPPAEQTALLPVKGHLRRLTADRGRVWRQVLLVQATGTDYQLEVPSVAAPDPNAIDAQPVAGTPNSESLPAGIVLYAFSETLTEKNQPIPDAYLGEFSVQSSQAGQITLSPTRALNDVQIAQIANSDSWTLYELLPLDSHTAFAADGSRPSDDAISGRMDEELLNALFVNIPEEDGRRESMVRRYLADGSEATDETPQSDIWIQVQLEKELTDEVDSEDSANATERGYFDPSGYSIDSRLKRGSEAGPVTITPVQSRTNRLVLMEEEARALLSSGDAQEVRRISVRPLNDYEQSFNNLFIRDGVVTKRITTIQRETVEIQKADQLQQEGIIAKQAENQLLASDLENFEKEEALIVKLAADAEEELGQMKQKLSNLYRQVQTLHAQRMAAQLSMAGTQ